VTPDQRRRWLSRRAIGLHVIILIVVPTFAGLCIWQVHRALSGNELSWAYVFEWPFFAGYAVYMWWRFIHEDPDAPVPEVEPARDGQAPEAAAPEAGDPELAAYNKYLADLAARDRAPRRR
jgi:hypothetical protein